MNNCPVCGKAVDPIRAPAVGVRDGKVVSYCSREHALEAESRPVMMPVATKKPDRAASDPAFPIPEGDQKKTKKRTPVSGVAQPVSLLDSGPVIEILHEPASGVVTSAPDARNSNSRSSPSAAASGAIQIADTGHIDDYVSQDDKPRSKAWVWALLVIVLGGGAFAAYQLGYIGGAKHPAKREVPVVAVVHDAGVADAAMVTPAAALASATVILQQALASQPPRVQRLAASALARTGDTVAIAALVAALAKETSDIAKIEILYALARGGDKRGVDGLVAALDGTRRDVKSEAAGRLALLGDKRALPTLMQLLDISQLSLGAAEQLGFLADPKGIKALEAVRADAKATDDEKARATIALGYANKAEIAPALHEMLTDTRQNAFAAAALANLHDPAGRPILVQQLETTGLGPRAARALRQLEPQLDATPILPPLLTKLKSAKDTNQIEAAETVLLLTGPAAWSAHE